MSIRKTVEYARMSPYVATSIAEGYGGESELEKMAAWQYLVDTGITSQLPSYLGYMADTLINSGMIEA